MALYKEITQEDGVVTNYHRILFMQLTINRQNSIAVLSYVNGDIREREKDCEITNPYQKSVTYECAYDPNMSIESAYEYLKTLPIFEGAEDIIEQIPTTSETTGSEEPNVEPNVEPTKTTETIESEVTTDGGELGETV